MEGKSSTNIWTIILVVFVLYMIWAYYRCQNRIKIGQNCHPLVGFRPITNLFGGGNHPVGHATSSDTSSANSSSTTSTISTTSTTSTTSTSSSVSILGNITVMNVSGAIIYNKTSNTNEVVATSNKIPSGNQRGYIGTFHAGICTNQVCGLPQDFYQLNATDFILKSDTTSVNRYR